MPEANEERGIVLHASARDCEKFELVPDDRCRKIYMGKFLYARMPIISGKDPGPTTSSKLIIGSHGDAENWANLTWSAWLNSLSHTARFQLETKAFWRLILWTERYIPFFLHRLASSTKDELGCITTKINRILLPPNTVNMPYTSPLGITTTKAPPKKLPQSKASQARSAASSPRLTPHSTYASSKNSSYFSTTSSEHDGFKEIDEVKPHVPSKELGEVSSRDRDDGVVAGLEHWKGWAARRESEDDGEDVGPLDEAENDKSGGQGVQVGITEVDLSSWREPITPFDQNISERGLIKCWRSIVIFTSLKDSIAKILPKNRRIIQAVAQRFQTAFRVQQLLSLQR
jgi:hypothetical protein